MFVLSSGLWLFCRHNRSTELTIRNVDEKFGSKRKDVAVGVVIAMHFLKMKV